MYLVLDILVHLNSGQGQMYIGLLLHMHTYFQGLPCQCQESVSTFITIYI